MGVLRSKDVLSGGRQQNIALEEHGVFLVHVLAAGEFRDGAGFLAVLLQGSDIQSLGIVDRTIVLHHGDNLNPIALISWDAMPPTLPKP